MIAGLYCGLGLSIPIVIFGSSFVAWLVRRLPALVMLGGALLGWVAGELLVHDRLLLPALAALALPPQLFSLAGAGVVLALGAWLHRSR